MSPSHICATARMLAPACPPSWAPLHRDAESFPVRLDGHQCVHRCPASCWSCWVATWPTHICCCCAVAVCIGGVCFLSRLFLELPRGAKKSDFFLQKTPRPQINASGCMFRLKNHSAPGGIYSRYYRLRCMCIALPAASLHSAFTFILSSREANTQGRTSRQGSLRSRTIGAWRWLWSRRRAEWYRSLGPCWVESCWPRHVHVAILDLRNIHGWYR